LQHFVAAFSPGPSGVGQRHNADVHPLDCCNLYFFRPPNKLYLITSKRLEHWWKIADYTEPDFWEKPAHRSQDRLYGIKIVEIAGGAYPPNNE
jgi:hypothetical protein